MKKLIMTLCVGFGLTFAFGSDAGENKTNERIVELSQIDWADVQSGMAASNRYCFAQQNVTIVITNKIEDIPGLKVIHFQPIGRMPEKITDRNKNSLLLEPQDYFK